MNTSALFLGAAVGAGFSTVVAAGISWLRVRHARDVERVAIPTDAEIERIHRQIASLSKSLEPVVRTRRGGVRRTGNGPRRR